MFLTQIHRDLTELFEGGFEVFDDFLGQHIGIGEVVRFCEASSVVTQSSRNDLLATHEIFSLFT